MRADFIKMHGLGNDFVILDARQQAILIDARRAAALANRNTGVGCDQLILLETSASADVFMRIFNADGSEVSACGNATRAVGLLLGGSSTIETAAGVLTSDASAAGITVDMGAPSFAWDAIPLAYPLDTAALPVSWDELAHGVAINVGNPHIVFFVDYTAAVDLAQLGPLIEHDALFPERVNVNIAQITGPSSISLRVWERGVGETLACGTGACATAVAAIASKRARGPVTVTLPGGALVIDWQQGGSISMTGPAVESFRGSVDLTAYPLAGA